MPLGPNRVQTEWVGDNCACVKRGVLILLACCPCAFALNPSLDIRQYAHTAWTIRDGFFDSAIQTIAQTPDGYLWLGTEFGLLRFDGVRKIPWQPPTGERLPSGFIRRLLVGRNGRLWIGTMAGLASWKDGKLIHYPELAGQNVVALVEENGGTVWAGGIGAPTGRLCAIGIGALQCFGQDGTFRRGVLSLFEENGSLWAGAQSGLWRWKPGPPKSYALPSLREISDFTKIDGGPLLIAMHGVIELAGEKTKPYPVVTARQSVDAVRLLEDRNGGLWIGTVQQGLLHVHQGKIDLFTRSEGLSGNSIFALFEDREGNIWVGTSEGLDRFRDVAIPTISADQGLSSDEVSAVLAGRGDSIWLGTPAGLRRWKDGQITVYGKRNGFPEGGVFSLVEDDRGRIWLSTPGGIGRFDGGRFLPLGSISIHDAENIVGDRPGSLWVTGLDEGLIHLIGQGIVDRIPWPELGHKDFAYALASDSTQGGLWLGFRNGGVTFFKDGEVRESYSSAEGLGGGIVSHLHVEPEGSVWAATAGGLSRIRNHYVATLNSRNGLPCDTVHWMIEDDQHSAWLYTACGLVRVDRAELEAWVADPTRTIKNTVFESSDGVRNQATARGYSPHVAKSADGRLWFATLSGVSVIDPRHLHVNKLPPPVHVEEVKVDGKDWNASRGWRLPALVRDVTIRYTALSFVAPEKVHFRYKLEGQDPDWKEVVNEREAQYTNLKPRNYHFRVRASNNNGVWNETGDSLDFSIAPAYYQTTWFVLSCVGAFFLMLWGMYRYRLHQIAEKFNAHLEGRINERVRVARDLHDTLLQGFQGLMLRLQVVDEMLPPGKAKQELEETLETGDQTIVEARHAVHDLRSPTTNMNDLAEALRALGQELATGHSASFRLVIEGPRRELHPIIRDEIYRIAREALRNAFAHSCAGQIEAEITFGERLFRLRIRDDGTGIPREVLSGGRSGHFGLAGMRERAKQISSQLTISSVREAGTEIELSVKGSIAYNKTSGAPGWRLFRRRIG